MNENVFESIFVKFELKHDAVTCITIYRSPMTNYTSYQQFITNLSSVLSHLKPNTKCFIYGDFNYDLLQAENRFINTCLFMNHYCKVFDKCFPLTNPRPKTYSNS